VRLRVRFHVSRELAPAEWTALRSDPAIWWTCCHPMVLEAELEIADGPSAQVAAVCRMYKLLEATGLSGSEYGPEALILDETTALGSSA